VTISTQNGECLFGDIVDGIMGLNDAGHMIERWYWELEQKFPDIQCGNFICMPNHVHFIVINVGAVGADLCVCPYNVCPNGDGNSNMGEHTGSPLRNEIRVNQGEHAGSPLPRVVQWFKTMTTNAYIDGVKHHHWQPFHKRLWQRNYYEHIVRNEDDLNRIQHYINDNPLRWQQVQLHPEQG